MAVLGKGPPYVNRQCYFMHIFEHLTKKKHSYELEPSGYTVVCLDYAQSGIGSNSCGPVLSEKYQLNQNHFEFDMTLIWK